MSAIIISLVLLLMITTTGLTGFYGRFNILDSELKERSFALAEACGDVALLALTNDPSWGGNATTSIGTAGECYVGPVSTGGGQKTFKTKSIYDNSFSIVHITLDATTLAVISWEEIPTY